MKTKIMGKKYTPSDKLKETIEKKYAKLDKYFSDEITGNILVIKEKEGYKVETTINAGGPIFRSEVKSSDPYDCVDRSIEKLSSQMSKFKKKLQKRYKGNKNLQFEAIPEYDEPEEEKEVVRTKKLQLTPMSQEEAVMQMEMLNHEFFVYLNIETDSVNVAYKRKDGNYGILETTY